MSSLEEFLKGAAPAAPKVHVVNPETMEIEGPKPESTEPKGVIDIILPSGIEVHFEAEPKRFYRARMHPDVELLPEQDAEVEQAWREVVSCSTITKILDKPGLVHWAEEVGVSGVKTLVERGWCTPEDLKRWSVEMIRDLMKRKNLRTWQSRDRAATRGTSVHKALEGWAMSGDIVDPEVFPANEQGYVIGLNRFLSDSGFVPMRSEVIVASLIHGFAGRFDLMGHIPEPVSISTKLTKAGIEHRETVQPDSYLVDLKTSSGVYDDHHLQVAGYQGICEESGYERPNQTAILRTSLDGKYEFRQGVGEWLDFWWCKGLYDSLAEIKERMR